MSPRARRWRAGSARRGVLPPRSRTCGTGRSRLCSARTPQGRACAAPGRAPRRWPPRSGPSRLHGPATGSGQASRTRQNRQADLDVDDPDDPVAGHRDHGLGDAGGELDGSLGLTSEYAFHFNAIKFPFVCSASEFFHGKACAAADFCYTKVSS